MTLRSLRDGGACRSVTEAFNGKAVSRAVLVFGAVAARHGVEDQAAVFSEFATSALRVLRCRHLPVVVCALLTLAQAYRR